MRALFLTLTLMASVAWAEGPQKQQALSATLPSPEQVKEAVQYAERKFSQREQELALEKEQLKALREEIAEMLEKLSRGCSQPEVPQITSVESGDEELREEKKRLLQLAESISGMQPEAAAVTLANIPVEEAVKLIMAVDSKKVGKILSQMPPEKAAQLITAVLRSQRTGLKTSVAKTAEERK